MNTYFNPRQFQIFCVVLEGCGSVLVFTANSLYTSDLGGEIALYWQVSLAVRHIWPNCLSAKRARKTGNAQKWCQTEFIQLVKNLPLAGHNFNFKISLFKTQTLKRFILAMTKYEDLILTNMDACFEGHGRSFSNKLVQHVIIKQTASGIIKTKTSIKNRACLFVSDEYLVVEFVVVSSILLNCCPRTSKQILLVTTHDKTAP